MTKIKLNYVCFLNQSGYSQAAQNYIFALHESNQFDIKLRIFGNRPAKPAVSDNNYEFFIKCAKKEDNKDRILIYHCTPTRQRKISRNKKHYNKSIGFATFETYNPPEKWIEILNKNNAIITPSKFNYRIFSHMKVKKPIYYIPHCINTQIYNKDVKPLRQYNKYTFMFMGIWRERKGYKQLLEAWLREFKENDNVQLLIKTDKPKRAEAYFIKLSQQLGINKGFAPVIFENKVFDEKELPKFMKSVDCLVLPTKGEGFCYPGLQCMALGIPVIVTDYSGCKDYANEETAVLIKPSGFVLQNNMDGIPQFRNKKWAFIEVEKIQQSMRYVLGNKKDIKSKANKAYEYVRKNFNYRNISKKFITMIRELYG